MRYRALHRYWRKHPRPEWLLAARYGFKPPPETSPLHSFARQRAQHTPAQGQEGLGTQAAWRGAGQHVPRPTGELQALFSSLGGKPGGIVVMKA